MFDHLIVGCIVVLASLYVAAKYLPLRWRERVVFALTQRGVPQATLVRIFNTTSGCGSGCDSCKACADPAPQANAPTAQRVIKLHVRR